jgi:hypothetical protein
MKYTSIALLAVCLSLMGCSSKKEEPPPTTHPVTGRIVYPDGSAYKGGGTIEFNAIDKSDARALGKIEPDGHFTLSIIGKKGQQEGAPAGEFTATIAPDQGQSQGQGTAPRHAQGRYRIKADETNELKVIVGRTK